MGLWLLGVLAVGTFAVGFTCAWAQARGEWPWRSLALYWSERRHFDVDGSGPSTTSA